uniref:LRRCT domain-containing protein n=1 Tax=Branchiostoma floridae TaxID=7739 RepID=C3ZNF5_BRAFL|eukprot:XP_002589897.1 hypothetical protein BRAFLDRAFT_81975 [Branchiostoma floridae]
MVTTSRIFVLSIIWLAFGIVIGCPCTELCTASIPGFQTRFLSCTRRGRFEKLCDTENPIRSEYTLIHSKSDKTLKQSSFRFSRPKLSRLFIRKTAIQRIDAGAFSHWPLLRMLSLTCNSQLSYIHRYSFQGLQYLETLDLRRNCLSLIVPGVFESLVKLSQLYLSHNKLMAIPMIAVESPPRSALFIDLSHNRLTFMSSRALDRVRGAFLQLDQNPFNCDEGWDWFSRHMVNSSRILCFKSVTCGPPPDMAPTKESVSSTPDHEVSEMTLPTTATGKKIKQSTYTPDGNTTTINHTHKRVEEFNGMESHAKTAVVGVAVTVVLGALLFAISCAFIKVRLGKKAGLAPAARPATDTVGHSENDCEDHQYEDCSYDSQPHVYDNDEDLQEGVVTDEDDTMNHVYDNWMNDNDHLASKPTDRVVSSPEIPENKTSEVVDQDPASQEGAQDGGFEQEEEHTSEAFADVATGSMDGGSNQQRAEGPPAIPLRMAAMTTDGGIADDVGTENVCTMKGNDTYEAAGTDTSREEPGGVYCTGEALSAHPATFTSSNRVNSANSLYGADVDYSYNITTPYNQ